MKTIHVVMNPCAPHNPPVAAPFTRLLTPKRSNSKDEASSDAMQDDLGSERLGAQVLGQYRLSVLLGRGGMGEVYRAEHVVLGKSFAIKLIRGEMLRNEEAIQRFVHEVTAIGQLHHPQIISATDAGTIDGIPYYVTELLEGHDLGQWMALRSPPSMEVACEIIRQAALGLAHAHARGFVHRDIKPSNLFLESRGNIKLLDFGLVRCQSKNSDLTCSGQLMGTVDYFAPEQAEDARSATIASDLYSLGATFIYLLSGDAPFPDSKYPALVSKLRGHLSETPPWLAQSRPNLPTALNQLLDSMMAKSPSDRPRSAEEVIEVLSHWSSGPRLQAWIKGTDGRSSSHLDMVASAVATDQQTSVGARRMVSNSIVGLGILLVVVVTALGAALNLSAKKLPTNSMATSAPQTLPVEDPSVSQAATTPAPLVALPTVVSSPAKTTQSAKAMHVNTSNKGQVMKQKIGAPSRIQQD